MATAVIMPKAGMSMETGTVVKWLKKPGDPVRSGEPLVEIETDKVVMEVEAEASGFLLAVLHDSGDVVPVTEPIAYIGTEAELAAGFRAEAAPLPVPSPNAAPDADLREALPTETARIPETAGSVGKIPMTPAARARARELGLDPAALSPSGSRGEVRLRDVEKALRETGSAGEKTPPPDHTLDGPAVERIPLSRARAVIAERLSQSMFTAPHYYLKASIPADTLTRYREAASEKVGRKISLNAFLLKFAAEALKEYPVVNASWQGDSIALFRSADIGLAVALPDGLITPVVRDCGSKGILRIDEELADLIARAKSGRLLPDEYKNATFTISNLGSFGVEEFTAVINPPGSAILAVGAFKKEPVVEEDGSVAARTLLRVTLSCDHRVIDGAVGAGFLRRLADILEYPIQALF